MSLNNFNDNNNSNNKITFFVDEIINTPKIKSKNSPISEFSFKPKNNQSKSNEKKEFNKENINITNISEFSTDLTEIRKNYIKLEDKNILFSGNFVSNKEINYKLNINSFENDTIITDNYTNIQNLKINLSENKKTSFSDFCIGIQINNKNNFYEKDYDMDVELEENNYNNYKDIEFENLYTNLFERNQEKKFLSMKRNNNKDIDELTEDLNNFSIKKKKKTKIKNIKFSSRNNEINNDDNNSINVSVKSISTTFSVKKKSYEKYLNKKKYHKKK